jgi:PRTRC genetic system protein A
MKKDLVLPDRLVQKYQPVIMAPKESEVAPCPVNSMRFIMGEEGLYLDTRTKWGALTVGLWQSPVLLPYGPIREHDSFQDRLPDVTHLIAGHMLDEIVRYAGDGLEWFGVITWDGTQSIYTSTAFDATRDSLNYGLTIPQGQSLIAEVHSHGLGAPGFSSVDDQDDLNGIKLSVVIGQCHPDRDSYPIVWRYCVNRFLFNENKGELCRPIK